jgi:hypothetical protein
LILARPNPWELRDTQTWIYLAAVGVGAPLAALQLWLSAHEPFAIGLLVLWVVTIACLVADLLKKNISMASTVLYFAWSAVGFSYTVYLLFS